MSTNDARPTDRVEAELSDAYLERFSGVGRVYGAQGLSSIASAHACVVGVGGVGVWSAEALARSGVGEITLIDLDDLCVTNINRQLHALTSTVGQVKVEVMRERLFDINPDIVVHTEQRFFTPKSEESLLSAPHGRARFDVLIDAIDHTERKALLIASCVRRSIPVVTCGAAGGRSAPQMITCADLSESTHDGLLRNVKRILRRDDMFRCAPQGGWGVKAVFSTERAIYPDGEGGVCHTPAPGESRRLGCESGFGSLSFVTGAFGFLAASEAINVIIERSVKAPLNSLATQDSTIGAAT